MSNKFEPLFAALAKSEEYTRLREDLSAAKGPVSVFGLGEAHRVHIEAALHAAQGGTTLIVAPSAQAAARIHEELSCYHPDAMLFPIREMPLNAHSYVQSQEIGFRRLRVLLRLLSAESAVVVAPIEAIMQRMAPPDAIRSFTHAVRVGMEVSPDALVKKLVDAGYTREEVCEGRGQLARRGGYIDVFPVTAENPVRIEFFGDEVDTMREFDPVSQRGTENISIAVIPPATELPLDREMRQRGIAALRGKAHYSEETETLREGGVPLNALALLPVFCREELTLLDYLPPDAVTVLDEPARIDESARFAYSQFMDGFAAVLQSGEGHEMQSGLLCAPGSVFSRLNRSRTAMLFALTRSFPPIPAKDLVKFETRPVPRYIPGDTAIRDDIALWKQKGFSVLLYAGEHYLRLRDMLADLGIEAAAVPKLDRPLVERELLIVGLSLPHGFEYPALRLAVVSEYELFGAGYRPAAKQQKRSADKLSLYDLAVGDLVVHEAHGIGRFTGVNSLVVDGKTRDYIEIAYQAGDKLFLPTDQLDRVQKYIGGDAEKQKLSRLGSGEWQKTVARTRSSVRQLAFDLVRLYGERSRKKGFRFSPDTDWQQRLELSFPYRETADQLRSIKEIKADMESDRIMDRLLCGDVGYGKTEVALRAAFKCAMDGKQCAFLVPTTILAQQHYNTLSSRYAGFPIRVELLSRFRTPKEQQEVKKQTAAGTVDILIGTHALLAKDVKFKDLGLLIVDEEQRFGVNHKEQIKDMKRNVDVLTLSATPIPRTLHMSMSGIRDMSVIETPPEARYPVQTYVVEYSEALVREAILKEIGRGGQVYIVYNRVATMDHYVQELTELIPEARIAFAHGQMHERQLENTMLDFLEGKYDVLVCSTIIESGLDISNVNTMIVVDADNMGLSQLYQLRGRVGRGQRLGYAYLTYRPNKVLSEVADKRLTAIREFTQFGAGFRIAMRDLEIRGAGDILGAEQHGHMAQVGYEMYCKLIDTAIREAKGEEIKPVFDTVMEIPIDANIPKKYIARETGRMEMYKRIAGIEDIDSFRDVQDELIDRYGEIPKSVQNLLDISLYKARASRLGITSFTVRPGEAQFVFAPNAPIDGAKLFAAVPSIDGAVLKGGEQITLSVTKKHAEPEAVFRAAMDAVNTLLSCIE
ncbi:MAG: transcription-repair coupling factor [Clostridia bacterium]|nr:transcription-repair coupling factor [Clostridia bacterium]